MKMHFSYGLLLAYPVREIFLRVVKVRGFWSYFLPHRPDDATSLLYELAERATAAAFGVHPAWPRCSRPTAMRHGGYPLFDKGGCKP